MKFLHFHKSKKNPVLKPDPQNPWETEGSFNGSIVKINSVYHLLYRAMSSKMDYEGKKLSLSTIGYAQSKDGVNFSQKRQFIKPECAWEKYGCEDPRVTYLDGKFYIFYTALSDFPPNANNIKVAVAVTKDLKKIEEKHLVTPFNAKAMVLFPKKINGKFTALLTANTDIPPAKIALAVFEKKEDIYSLHFWQKWYQNLEAHTLRVQRLNTDQVEIGSVPLETNKGWLLFYAHIQNYYSEKNRVFGVEALLLDKGNPQKIIGRTDKPLLIPTQDYELEGKVKNVIFPSGALIKNKEVFLYYGSADTTCSLAVQDEESITSSLSSSKYSDILKLKRYQKNPILQPRSDQPWQSKAVFNPAAIYLDNKFYLIYRALSNDNTSTLGCAASSDGINFTQCSNEPVYVPRMDFEQKKKPNVLSGCEDPRITQIGEKLYMFYTAFDSVNPPRVALTSISAENFKKHQWLWSKPILISPFEEDDKNACLFPEKINGDYLIFHRIGGKDIAIDFIEDLDFEKQAVLEKEKVISPRPEMWDSEKIGICGPPIKTDKGWLLFYHAVNKIDHHYRIGFMLLNLENPTDILFRTKYPILEPVEDFERYGFIDNVVFSCGAVLHDNNIYFYYGGADKVICLATTNIEDLISYALT